MFKCYKYIMFIVFCAALFGCASGREFWTYVVEDPVQKPMPPRTDDKPISTPNSTQYIKVNFNDGALSTEVQIPLLSSGQQILIDHKGRSSERNLVGLLPIPPTPADQALEDAYIKEGGTISNDGKPISLLRTQTEIHTLARQGNYALALEYTLTLLQRYPNHVETLRTKGALLLKMGERRAALEAYEKAQDLQPNARVQKQIDQLQKTEEL